MLSNSSFSIVPLQHRRSQCLTAQVAGSSINAVYLPQATGRSCIIAPIVSDVRPPNHGHDRLALHAECRPPCRGRRSTLTRVRIDTPPLSLYTRADVPLRMLSVGE